MASTPAVPHLPESTAYSWPVPREFVHKAAHNEVLLTGWRRCGGGRFEVGAQWPRDHGFWRTDGEGVQDPLLLVETTRQVMPLLAHAAYGLPGGSQLIWERYHCAFAAPFLSVADSPAEVVLRLSASPDPDRGARPRRMSLTMTVHGAGRELGRVASDYSAHSPRVYARLRGPGTPPPAEAMAAAVVPPPPLPPWRVGRESEREVVLAPSAADGDEFGGQDGDGGEDADGDGGRASRAGLGRRQLRVLTGSPWLFDHPVDHAPGMLLLEAARQAMHLVAAPHRPQLTALKVHFHRYVDLDAPSWVEISPGPDGSPGAADGEESGTDHSGNDRGGDGQDKEGRGADGQGMEDRGADGRTGGGHGGSASPGAAGGVSGGVTVDAVSLAGVSVDGVSGGGTPGSGADERSLTVRITQHGQVAFTAVVGYLAQPAVSARPPVLR